VLAGVYVPALHHLRAYQPPVASPSVQNAARCMLRFGDYLSAIGAGYPGGYAWVLLLRLAERLGLPEQVHGEGRFAPGTDAEAFFVFAIEQERVGIVLVDQLSNPQEFVAAAARATVGGNAPIQRFIVVCRNEPQAAGGPEDSEKRGLVICDD